MKPFVRTTRVGGVDYTQVILRGHRSSRVLKSFGRDSLENYVRAHMFLAAYNSLESLLCNGDLEAYPPEQLARLESYALAEFGWVLGKDLILGLIKANARESAPEGRNAPRLVEKHS